jgi:hypothetical protein
MDLHIYFTDEGYDKEIYEHGFTVETLKSFLHIGYELYKHRVLKQLDVLVDKNIESIVNSRVKIKEQDIYNEVQREVQREVQKELDELKNENLELVRKLDESMVSKQYLLEIEKQNLKIQHMDDLLSSSKKKNDVLEKQIQDLYNDIYKDSIQQLKDTIKQKETEISILKNTNIVKGCIGENHITNVLKNIFTECDVIKTGKVAHVCDVHMCFPSGKKIVFESKYKGNITKLDVDKFYNDVEKLDDSVIGGVFVSFLSRNIPNKGSINFEITSQSKKPLMYIAYDNEDEFNMFFTHNILMFVKLCEAYNIDTKTSLDIQNTIQEVKFICDMVSKQKKRLDDIKSRFQKYTQETEDDMKVLFNKMDNMFAKVPIKETRKRLFICTQCTYTCGSQRTLTKHINDNHLQE